MCAYPDINYFRDFAREKDLRVLSLDLYNGILPNLSLLPFPLQSLFSLIFLIVCARLTCYKRDKFAASCKFSRLFGIEFKWNDNDNNIELSIYSKT